MSGLARVALAIAALTSFLGGLTASANAITWHNTGSTSFTATAGPGTFSSTSVNLTCSGSRATGTAAATSVGAIYLVSGTATANCLIAGVQYYSHCAFTLTAISQLSSSVTTGNTDQTCSLRLTANNVAVCGLDGTTPGTYTNPSGATPGRITNFTSSSLKLTNGPTGTCPLGNGDVAVLSHKTGTVTGGVPTSLGPVLTRTA